jgi:cob(I)alamin adenosyltransferase
MKNQWKIYTKTGDKGETSLIGGKRVPKFHLRIEAYGTLDELNAFIGLVRDQDIDTKIKDVLLKIQNVIFTAESQLALDPEAKTVKKLPEIKAADILLLETEIDTMNDELPVLTKFLLPGGHPVVSYCHIARTVCRRAERIVIKLSREEKVDDTILRFLNRLSDYLFILSRKLTKDLGIDELHWITKG